MLIKEHQDLQISGDPGMVAGELILEKNSGDLLKLEHMLEQKLITENDILNLLIYDWPHHKFDSPHTQEPRNQPVYIQYEGLRDGDQIGVPGVFRLSSRLDIAKDILKRLPEIGVTIADLGMPVSGPKEQQKILDMVSFLSRHNIPIIPAVAGRTADDDVIAIRETAEFAYKNYGQKLWVYAFVGSSRIRMLAEGQQKWNTRSISDWVANSVSELKNDPHIGGVIVPFEDTYGSFPQDLDIFFRSALDSGADGICICDTCSRGIQPSWTANLLHHIKDTFVRMYPDRIWEIHTHNMLGNAVANAVNACNEPFIAGIHGTLGGVGDLGGNMAIETFILHAIAAGIMKANGHGLLGIYDLVTEELTARGIDPRANPFPGTIYAEASRLVPTGIHASAFKRLKDVGPHLTRIFEQVYFPFSPTSLGLKIRLDIVTAVSGKSNVYEMGQRLGIREDQLTPDVIRLILQRAKEVHQEHGVPLSDDDFLGIIQTNSPPVSNAYGS